MGISNIYSAGLWASSGGQCEISTTIVRAGGKGWAFAETELSRSRGSGAAYAWISGYRYQPSDDQIFNAISPDPTARSVPSGSATANRPPSRCASSITTPMPWPSFPLGTEEQT
jgi:hypothetical protein